MGFFETIFAYIGFFNLLVLIGSPIIIFSATPRMPFWYKSGRIVFLWACATGMMGFTLYETLTDPELIGRWGMREQAYQHYILLSVWGVFLINIVIGWLEFLWRCVYRQWAWPPLKNLRYGIISNLCIFGSAVFTIPLALLLIVVSIVKIIY